MAENEVKLDESGGSNEIDSKRRKPIMERSVVWDHFEKIYDPNGELTVKCALLSTDWEKVRRMMKFLEIFYELTLKVSGSLYVTSNVHFIEIGELHYILKDLIQSEGSDLSEMAANMKEKFDTYWGKPEKMNKMIFIACILDPRYKDEYVTYALVSMLGEEIGNKIVDEVKRYMASLFNEYARKHSEKRQSSSSSSGSTLDLPSVSSHQIQFKKSAATFTQQFKKHKADSGSSKAQTELDKYLGEATENGSDDFNILVWWKMNSPRFPILAEMTRDVLAVPVSSVALESAFSAGGRILDSFRSSLTPKVVQALVCCQDWLRSDSLPVGIEEDLDYLEKFELDLVESASCSRIIDI